MPEAKFLKCACAQCGGHIEFPADGIGATIPCPHCGQETELSLEAPRNTSAESSRSRKWIIAGIVILVVGIAGVAAALVTAQKLVKRAQQRAAVSAPRSAARTNAAAQPAVKPATTINDFAVLNVAIEKKAGSSLLYATGTIRNDTDRQRFGVNVEVDVFDGAGQKVGSARDYRDALEPRSAWTFRALVVSKNATAARVVSVTEQQ